MKKLIVILLALVIALAFVACDEGGSSSSDDTKKESSTSADSGTKDAEPTADGLDDTDEDTDDIDIGFGDDTDDWGDDDTDEDTALIDINIGGDDEPVGTVEHAGLRVTIPDGFSPLGEDDDGGLLFMSGSFSFISISREEEELSEFSKESIEDLIENEGTLTEYKKTKVGSADAVYAVVEAEGETAYYLAVDMGDSVTLLAAADMGGADTAAIEAMLDSVSLAK